MKDGQFDGKLMKSPTVPSLQETCCATTEAPACCDIESLTCCDVESLTRCDVESLAYCTSICVVHQNLWIIILVHTEQSWSFWRLSGKYKCTTGHKHTDTLTKDLVIMQES